MNCETARDALLEADLPELRGEGDGPLARHLRSCPACRERARRLLDQTAALATTLERMAPRTAEITRRGRAAGTRRLPPWAVAVPLALAAGLAVWLLPLGRTDRAAVGDAAPVALSPTPLHVGAPAGRAVAVFQTDNPNIVIIWSF